MNLTWRLQRLVMVEEHKTSEQYLTTGKLSTRSIFKLRRYWLLKTLTKNFNLRATATLMPTLWCVVTAIALLVLRQLCLWKEIFQKPTLINIILNKHKLQGRILILNEPVYTLTVCYQKSFVQCDTLSTLCLWIEIFQKPTPINIILNKHIYKEES